MKLLVESDFKPAGGLIGASLENLVDQDNIRVFLLMPMSVLIDKC
jgi:hypothetical protein